MSVGYEIFKRKIVTNSTSEEKYVARLKKGTEIKIDEVARLISYRSTMSIGDITGVVAELEEVVALLLTTGHAVSLGRLGKFVPTINAESQDSPDKVRADTIRRFKCYFRPSKYLREKFKEVKYRLVSKEIREPKWNR